MRLLVFVPTDGPDQTMTLVALRWLTVLVPLAFLIAIDYLRHFVFPTLLHPFRGYLIVLAVVALAVWFFSGAVFEAFQRMQRCILDQNRELAAIGETARRQAAQLRALHEAGLALAGDLSLEVVLQRGVDLARELVGARYGTLAVLDNGEVAYFLTSGLDAGERAALGRPSPERAHLDVVSANGRSVRVDDLSRLSPSAGFLLPDLTVTSLLGVPIVAKGRTLGSFYLADKTGPDGALPFTPEDEELLRLFAAQAAVALENAQLHSKVESLAATAERARLARELHDSFAQAFGFVGVRSQAAQAALAAGNLADVGQALVRIRAVAEMAYADVREAILGLRSQVGANRDLVQALREYLDRYRFQSGIRTELEVVGAADRLRLAPAAEVQLLRIIQEALANVRKHARARVTRVRLEQVDLPDIGLVLRVSVEDDGQGFDPASVASESGRYGLTTMRERAEEAGGRLRVESAPGAGARVVVELPALGFPVPLGEPSQQAGDVA